MDQIPKSHKLRMRGMKIIGCVWLLALVVGIYSLFNDSAFFIWNKTREEILFNFYWMGFSFLGCIWGLYYIAQADELVKQE
jgi:hypothetical protein